jgi:tRNA(Ile)-lysidine synthase
MMTTQFQSFIDKAKLFSKSNRLLLGVSGGIDSRVMLDLFLKTGYQVAVAHCNFKLRGEESDADEFFVESLAKNYNTPFYRMHFNTQEYAELQKISIQMAARELRYNWFENVRRNFQYDFIAIAHNADDAIETFFINLIRGTGIRGLTGIRPKNNNIVRPLLFATRKDIETYCTENDLQYRNDNSNFSDKYLRNNIRHNIVTAFEEFPDFRQTMKNNLDRLKDAEKIYNAGIQALSKDIVKQNGEEFCIDICGLRNSGAERTLLHEVLLPFQFTTKTIDEISRALDTESGAVFYSESSRLIKDRQKLIVLPLKQDETPKYYLDEETSGLTEPLKLSFRNIESEGFTIPTDKKIAAIDKEKISYPLILRRWQKGDYFQPLGMNGIKKVSDYFVDNKFSISEKENTWILASGDQIIWIIGHRLDDRFKITPKTQEILVVEVS